MPPKVMRRCVVDGEVLPGLKRGLAKSHPHLDVCQRHREAETVEWSLALQWAEFYLQQHARKGTFRSAAALKKWITSQPIETFQGTPGWPNGSLRTEVGPADLATVVSWARRWEPPWWRTIGLPDIPRRVDPSALFGGPPQ